MLNMENPIAKEMVNLTKELFNSDFTITADKKRYMWDSEKKKFIDLDKECEENDEFDDGLCTCSCTYF